MAKKCLDRSLSKADDAIVEDKIVESENAIEVRHLSKYFKLPTEKSNSIKQVVINRLKGIKGYKKQQVLRDISFEVKKGDFFGIVGRNGSGKSTLLKLISGIYTPNGGSIKVDGSLVSFIELGVGFNPELTGRENIFLNGALMGFTTKEVAEMYDEIVDFAELRDFMDQKLKNYSSGMQVRLAFSCAIRAHSDILVLDEILAVGDEAFQRKCNNYFATLKREKKTVILVTHSMDAVQQYCNKAILIQDGKITVSGNTAEVAKAYRDLNNAGIKTEGGTEKTNLDGDSRGVSAKAKYEQSEDKIVFDVDLKSKMDLEDAVITFAIVRDTGEMVYRWASDEKVKKRVDLEKGKVFRLRLELEKIFPDGKFDVAIGIKDRDRTKTWFEKTQLVQFDIVTGGSFPRDTCWKPKEEFKFSEEKK